MAALEQLFHAAATNAFLVTLDSPDYAFRTALPIRLYPGEDSVAAHAVDLEVHGEGESEYEALADLRRVICDEYEALQQDRSELGPPLLSRLSRFDEVIERRPRRA